MCKIYIKLIKRTKTISTYALAHPNRRHAEIREKGQTERDGGGEEKKIERVRGHKLGKVTATDPNNSMIIAW